MTAVTKDKANKSELRGNFSSVSFSPPLNWVGKGNILQETALSTIPSIQKRVDDWTDHCRGISKPNFAKMHNPLKK